MIIIPFPTVRSPNDIVLHPVLKADNVGMLVVTITVSKE